MQIIHPDIQQYAKEHTTKPSPEARTLIQITGRDLEYSDMLSGEVIGQLLAMLIRVSRAKRVLEVGMFTGYSALRMAEALPEDGRLITCEYNERYAAIAQSIFEQNKHGQKITIKMGAALQTIQTLGESFDFIFLDADKINYPNYYQVLLPKLSIGGLLVIDNILWGGGVLMPRESKAQAIDQLNKIIAKDECVEQVMLTVRDGLTIVQRIKE